MVSTVDEQREFKDSEAEAKAWVEEMVAKAAAETAKAGAEQGAEIKRGKAVADPAASLNEPEKEEPEPEGLDGSAEPDTGGFLRVLDEARRGPSLAGLVTVVAVKPGFTCKFNGSDYEVTAVSADGRSADLKVLATGSKLLSVPVAELRFIRDLDAEGVA